MECDVIFDNTYDVLEANSTIYIATGTFVSGNRAISVRVWILTLFLI